MNKQFKWRDGFRARIAADVAAAELERIRESNKGVLEAAVIVAAAKPKNSKLHSAFDWDNADAAHEWRKSQARSMTAALLEYEVVEGKNEPVEHRVYEFVKQPDNGGERRVYAPTTTVLSETHSREQLLERARREAASYQRRYAALAELADIFTAMSRTFETTD